jgi:hypothetical protein
MKIRTGFVSNSSSSSFLMYGICLESSELQGFLSKIKKSPDSLPEYARKLLEDPEFEEGESSHEIAEALAGMLGKNYSYNAGPEAENFYFGRSWDSVKDDETGKQFKNSIEEDLKKFFGKDIEVSTHEEAGFDG